MEVMTSMIVNTSMSRSANIKVKSSPSPWSSTFMYCYNQCDFRITKGRGYEFVPHCLTTDNGGIVWRVFLPLNPFIYNPKPHDLTI